MDEKEQPQPQHQVFINFRGKNLRNNFISRLVNALNDLGIKVVTDIQARMKVKVYEIKMALGRAGEDQGAPRSSSAQGAIPIFYKVVTSDVKQLKGYFGKHFWDQERKCKASRMKKWKKALEFVSGNIGLRWDTE
ncbi:predicted protein, partial [Arabidopsis lyrata subsp. lyrata]